MRNKQGSPLTELPVRNTIPFAYVLYRAELKEMFRQNPQDEEQPICTVGNDMIWEYCMSVMTAVADNPHYTDGAFESLSVNEVSDGSVIVSVDMAFAY